MFRKQRHRTNSKNLIPNIHIPHYTTSDIKLAEDVFGIYYDKEGVCHLIKRFTWTNHNNIQVQIITYGARITSIKFPNNKGVIEDVVLGCEDLAGYLYYKDFMFGAVVGRVADKVENATFQIDGKQYWLSKNDQEHHKNGGFQGFDKAIWQDYVKDTTVVLTHVFPHLQDGYPGDLFVQIFFQLTKKNEFTIRMEAQSSRCTIINMSNKVYFNLAGHNQGSSELYKHTLTVNANCFTSKRPGDGFPDGTIMNVIHTKFDYQIPKLLGKEIGINPEDGINQNLCVNRGVYQENCFIARILHSPSGRMVEIYSNQPAVNLSTANHFGPGLTISENTIEETTDPKCCSKVSIAGQKASKVSVKNSLDFTSTNHCPGMKPPSKHEEIMNTINLVERLHEKMSQTLDQDRENDFSELRDLIQKIQENRIFSKQSEPLKVPSNTPVETTPETDPPQLDEREMMQLMLNPLELKYLQDLHEVTKQDSITDYSEIAAVIEKLIKTFKPEESSISESSTESMTSIERREMEKENERKRKGMIKVKNVIPKFYKDGKIHGKQGAIYSRHGAICLETQNYPNAIYHENFPNCILRPGEVYKHTITYKFWIRQGSPNKFNRRYRKDLKQREREERASKEN